MKFLKTHTGAMVVLAVVIVLSVLLGSHRSLVQARERVEAQFAPIAGDLQDCLDITANLLTVAGRYLDEGELGELTDSLCSMKVTQFSKSFFFQQRVGFFQCDGTPASNHHFICLPNSTLFSHRFT